MPNKLSGTLGVSSAGIVTYKRMSLLVDVLLKADWISSNEASMHSTRITLPPSFSQVHGEKSSEQPEPSVVVELIVVCVSAVEVIVDVTVTVLVVNSEEVVVEAVEEVGLGPSVVTITGSQS